MPLLPVDPNLAARLANYEIDDRARLILREMAPFVERELDAAIEAVIAGAVRLIAVAALYKAKGNKFRQLEGA